MDEPNGGGSADDAVDPDAYRDDHEDEGGEKTGRDLEEVAEEDTDTMPPDGDDEKVKRDKGEVA
jgi:hypothetical protein